MSKGASEVMSEEQEARTEKQSQAGQLHLAPSQDPASREEILPREIMITALSGSRVPRAVEWLFDGEQVPWSAAPSILHAPQA